MFVPIETAEQLPAIGVANEKTSIDFKATIDPANRLESAKDVAAFANGEGGTIVIGAAAKGEFVTAYLPLTHGDASAIQRAYEESVRDRCRPFPNFTIDPIDYEGGKVVAVNVWPSVGQPVGVELKKDDLGKKLEGVFYYPIRAGAHTKAIYPEQMHMFVDARFRRTVLALKGSKGARIKLLGRETNADWWGKGEVVSVDESANALELLLDFGMEKKRISLPLDVVEAVWRDGDSWKIRIPGCIRPISWLPKINDEYTSEELTFMEVAPGIRTFTHPSEQRVRVVNFPEQRSPMLDALRSLRDSLFKR